VKELRPTSNQVLGDPVALREAIDNEGYVLLRDVIDRQLVSQVKHGVMAWFESQQIVKVVDDEPMHTGVDAGPLGDYPAGLYDTKLWEWFALRPEMRRFYEQVFGERARVLPIGEYQFTWPGRPSCLTKVHQDGPFTTALDFLVFWIPLMVIDEAVGGLSILPTPQSRGSLHPDLEKNPTSPWIPRPTFPEDEWHRADYRPGDVLIFGPFTPHCGLPNTSDRLRLSIDIRAQQVSAKRPITGVVIGADADLIVIAADQGGEVALVVDEETALRLPTWLAGRLDRSLFLGQRVIATEQDGRALTIRNPWGHVPWEE
jgi:hypothetical protein